MSIDLQTLKDLATARGDTIEGQESDPPQITARTADGQLYVLYGSACDESAECVGLNIQVLYTVDTEQDYELLNKANVSRAAVSTWRSEETLGVSRYLIFDGGQTFQNVLVNINVLVGTAPIVLNTSQGWDQEE